MLTAMQTGCAQYGGGEYGSVTDRQRGSASTESLLIAGVLSTAVLLLAVSVARGLGVSLVVLAAVPAAFTLLALLGTAVSGIAYRRERRKASGAVRRSLEKRLGELGEHGHDDGRDLKGRAGDER
jgi:hypothetical protein